MGNLHRCCTHPGDGIEDQSVLHLVCFQRWLMISAELCRLHAFDLLLALSCDAVCHESEKEAIAPECSS